MWTDNQVNEADQVAMMAYELKTVKGMMRCHPDFTRDGSAIQYAYYKLDEVVNKLEGK